MSEAYKKGILKGVKSREIRENLLVFNSIDSTNNELKRRALQGAKDKTAAVAEHQTGGRGRMGRSFYSPTGGGVYMSMLYRLDLPLERVVLATTAAAVAVSRAIKSCIGIYPQIKWVNDLYIDGKKVCGILAETVSTINDGQYLIIGVGVNCGTTFPDELCEIAGNLPSGNSEKLRCKLAAKMLDNLSQLDVMINTSDFISEYREHSMLTGKEVTVLQQPGSCYFVEGIGDMGELILKDGEGNITVLNTGEVSVRVKRDVKKQPGPHKV